MPGRACSASSARSSRLAPVRASQHSRAARRGRPGSAAGHRGQERGEGLGLDVVGLGRAGLHERPDGPAQSREEHSGQPDGPAAAFGLGPGDEFADDGVADLEAGGGVQEPGLQLAEGDQPVGEAGECRCRRGRAGWARWSAATKVRSRVSKGESVRGRRRVRQGGLLSFRSRDRATPGPPVFPRISPTWPGGGLPRIRGSTRATSSPPRDVYAGQRSGVVVPSLVG